MLRQSKDSHGPRNSSPYPLGTQTHHPAVFTPQPHPTYRLPPSSPSLRCDWWCTHDKECLPPYQPRTVEMSKDKTSKTSMNEGTNSQPFRRFGTKLIKPDQPEFQETCEMVIPSYPKKTFFSSPDFCFPAQKKQATGRKIENWPQKNGTRGTLRLV